MKNILGPALVLVSLGLFTACDDTSAPAPTTPPTPQVDDHAGHDHAGHDHGTESMAENVGEVAGDAKETAVNAYEEVKEETKEAAASGKEKMDQFVEGFTKQPRESQPAPGTPPMPGATPNGNPGISTTSETQLELDDLKPGMSLDTDQADGVLATIQSLINENNLTQAEQWLTKLEGVTLPAGYGEKVTSLKTMLGKAKGAGDMLNNLSK